MKRPAVKTCLTGLFALLIGLQYVFAAEPGQSDALRQEIIDLSHRKWQWMSAREVGALDSLFHKEAVFVHMGGAMSKERELDVIRSGGIHYAKADVYEESVRFAGQTVILLGRIRLRAVVGGREVVNPFLVTEVYVREDDAWKLASLSFTRLLVPEED